MPVDCPTCGKQCKSERGMKVHHARSHNEKIGSEKVTCDNCGTKFERHKSDIERTDDTFCSQDCAYEHRENKKELTCDYCGETVMKAPWYAENQKFCSAECHHESMKSDTPRLDAGSEAKEFRKSVYEKFDYTCQDCGSKGNVHAHHIKRRKTHPELAFDVDNGIALCPECHAQRHEEAGEEQAAAAVRAGSNIT